MAHGAQITLLPLAVIFGTQELGIPLIVQRAHGGSKGRWITCVTSGSSEGGSAPRVGRRDDDDVAAGAVGEAFLPSFFSSCARRFLGGDPSSTASESSSTTSRALPFSKARFFFAGALAAGFAAGFVFFFAAGTGFFPLAFGGAMGHNEINGNLRHIYRTHGQNLPPSRIRLPALRLPALPLPAPPHQVSPSERHIWVATLLGYHGAFSPRPVCERRRAAFGW